jgi:hypothetical protein
VLLDTFYGLRPLSVRTADSLSVNVDRLNQAMEKALTAKGGGGGGGGAESVFIRQNYKDTAHWAAGVNTDAQGRARVQIVLPDNLTTWVFDARAVTPDTKVGQGRNEVVAARPLLIRPVAPRFFVRGRVDVRGTLDVSAPDMPATVPVGGPLAGQRLSSFNSRGGVGTLVIVDGQPGGAGGPGGGAGGAVAGTTVNLGGATGGAAAGVSSNRSARVAIIL